MIFFWLSILICVVILSEISLKIYIKKKRGEKYCWHRVFSNTAVPAVQGRIRSALGEAPLGLGAAGELTDEPSELFWSQNSSHKWNWVLFCYCTVPKDPKWVRLLHSVNTVRAQGQHTARVEIVPN